MGHVLALFTLWLVINREDVQEPVFEKVISVRLTKNTPSHLPPINQAQRDKIAEENAKKKKLKDNGRKRLKKLNKKSVTMPSVKKNLSKN